ncbi:MAG: hypothetical protein QHJ73_19575, partial [Armatimonadota bacterium]|nr:hypothetical protein [Armatimonadota bacterium]
MLSSLILAALVGVNGVTGERPLLSVRSTDGVRRSMGPEDARIELVTGPGNTTDGDGAIRFSVVSPVAAGNKYAAVTLSLPQPVDLRERRLLFDARTDHPEDTQAFYVRCYNQGESRPAWSFNSWDGRLQRQWRTFSLQAGLGFEGLAWEPSVVENRVADR